MKKRLYLMFLPLLLAVLSLGGCSDDSESAPDSVYLYSTEQKVKAEAGTKSVTIFTTCGWTAEGDTWISVDPVSGGDKGIHVVKLTYTANGTSSERRGTVTFRAGTYTEIFTLIQEGK